MAGAATVSVTKAAKTCFADTVAMTGVLVPKEEIFVRPEREGLQISQVLVEEGDRVTAGQALIRLIQPDAPAGTAATTLAAPVAGTVRRIAATVGTMASVRAEPLVQIISQGEIELQADAVPSQLVETRPRATGQDLGRRRWRGGRPGAAARGDHRSDDPTRADPHRPRK